MDLSRRATGAAAPSRQASGPLVGGRNRLVPSFPAVKQVKDLVVKPDRAFGK